MTDSCDTAAVAAWLIDGAPPAAHLEDVLAELCQRLASRGVPLWRVAVFVRTLHPDLLGRRLLWRAGQGVEVSEAPLAFTETEDFQRSPVVHVHRTGTALRRRPADPGSPADFVILAELRAEGVTDYLASPLAFTNGEVHVATWSTRRAGGFTEAEIAGIERVVAPLARLVETFALRRLAANLLDVYVGHHTGARILAGRIRRGDTETIRAAIWLSDMRGFTQRADRLPPRVLIDLLNRFFDCRVAAIAAEGGEVLKFMGDGLMAIFPIADGDAGPVCRAALAAACRARDAVAAMAGPAGEEADPPRLGLALHLGEVLYGNIGGGGRLDFTCIGPAVNLAARLEALSGRLGRSIIASEPFARRCPSALVPLGAFALPGFAAPQPAYGLPDEPR
ncbi:MAG: adenylate/guanylate cyclase domain-containing protein [Rhodospirillaceae bacterium]|nr:adenylate/guanylate cyclase domain-containing protein [Rhodospirillaceae bacterium]